MESIHKAERRDRRGHRVIGLAGLVVAALLASTWVALFGFLGANSAFGTVSDIEATYIPNVTPLPLDLPNLGRLSRVSTSDGVLLGTLTERNSQPVPLEEIPETVVLALLAAEDEGFYQHEGIDFRAIARATIQDLKGGALQGGSTITQQVVKQNFNTQERTIERKIREAVLAAELERRYTKDEILEFYVNSVYFGWNAYGINAASQEYFGKDLDELTLAEAAALPTAIRNPTQYDMRRNPNQVVAARNAVIDNMVEEGWVTDTQALAAKLELLTPIEHQSFEQIAPEIVIATTEALLNDPSFGLGDTYLDRVHSVFGCPASDAECAGGGGLDVTVSINWRLQQAAKDILREWFPVVPGEIRPTGAISLIENETGAVRVRAGGLEFGTDLAAGQRDYDLAGKGRQNAGSAFKPIGLVTALEQGVSLNSWWDWTNPQVLEFPGSSKPWNCNNFSRSGEGIRTLRSATINSTNTVYCQVSIAAGAENIVDVAHRLGIESPLNAVPSIVLGTQAVSPLEMAAAYSTIANYGSKREAYLIERIVNADGEVIYQHQVEPEQVVDEALAAVVVDTLKGVVREGTGTRANIGRPQGGKTGTHQGVTDVWFVGFIRQYTASVWVGHADGQASLRNVWIHGDRTTASSSRIPAPIWRQFMEIVTEELPIEEFPPIPEGAGQYLVTPSTEVPNVSSLSSVKAMKHEIHQAGLNVSIVETPSEEEEGTILSQAPAAGSKVRQGGTVVITISTGEPPEVKLPDLRWLTVGPAAARLDQLFADTEIRVFYVAVDQVTAARKQEGLIITTSPPPGSLVQDGATVTLHVGRFVQGGGDG